MLFIYGVKKVLPLLLLIGIAGFFYVKNISNRLAFSIDAIRFDGPSSLASGFTNLYFDVDLSVDNKNSFPITFNSYGIDFYYQGVKAGTITRRTGIEISPNIQSITTARLSIPVNSVGNVIGGMITEITNGKPVYFDVKAVVKTNYFGAIPYTTKIQVV